MGKGRIIHSTQTHHILCNFGADGRKLLRLLRRTLQPCDLCAGAPTGHTAEQNLFQPMPGGAKTGQMRQCGLSQGCAVWRWRHSSSPGWFTLAGNCLAAGLPAQRARTRHTAHPNAARLSGKHSNALKPHAIQPCLSGSPAFDACRTCRNFKPDI